ncbi:hypothetical protein DERP_003669 [Dermatophagoides pteronyssinus]|uniref:Uncharacterized protein n=1 Tax=Dermatophagoides pteronyssinus TaxID=6956 RepID=A0ABQ8JLT4_DERPT|nr:hypothetical protein DERP_003669 [Dermatophagoides pteronyssinus]
MDVDDIKDRIKLIKSTQKQFPQIERRQRDLINKWAAIEVAMYKNISEQSITRQEQDDGRSTPIDESIQGADENETVMNPQATIWPNYTRWNPRPGSVRIQAKQIQKFSGDPIDYHKFREDIEHYIIDNPEIDGAKNKLKEIQDLLPTKHRYLLNRIDRRNPKMDEIKKVLDQHYGGRHQIIPALTRKIQSAPYLSARPQLKDYEEMLEVVISIVDTLNLTNLKSEDYHLSTRNSSSSHWRRVRIKS